MATSSRQPQCNEIIKLFFFFLYGGGGGKRIEVEVEEYTLCVCVQCVYVCLAWQMVRVSRVASIDKEFIRNLDYNIDKCLDNKSK